MWKISPRETKLLYYKSRSGSIERTTFHMYETTYTHSIWRSERKYHESPILTKNKWKWEMYNDIREHTYYILLFFLMIEKRKPQVKLTNLISYSCVYVKMRVLCAEELSDTKCFIFFLFYKINTSLYFQHKMSINK